MLHPNDAALAAALPLCFSGNWTQTSIRLLLNNPSEAKWGSKRDRHQDMRKLHVSVTRRIMSDKVRYRLDMNSRPTLIVRKTSVY